MPQKVLELEAVRGLEVWEDEACCLTRASETDRGIGSEGCSGRVLQSHGEVGLLWDRLGGHIAEGESLSELGNYSHLQN